MNVAYVHKDCLICKIFRTVVMICNLIKRKDVKLTIRMHAVFHLGVMRHMVVVCNL